MGGARLLIGVVLLIIVSAGAYGFHAACFSVSSANPEASAGLPDRLTAFVGALIANPSQRWDLIYRSAQLFFLNFETSCPAGAPKASFSALPASLELARFSAAGFSFLTVLSLLLPRLRRWFLVRWQILFGHRFGNDRRAIVLGYGPTGQAVASELKRQFRPRRSRLYVTAIEANVTADMRARARRDGVLLAEGDPADPQVHRLAHIDKAGLVISAGEDDLRTVDAVIAARASIGAAGHGLRAVLRDPELAASLSEEALRGMLGASGVRAFSICTEAARLLVAEARFDRVALEAGQHRVHLAVLGCGPQGEAVATETLLTAWRSELGPPVVTILDAAFETVRDRFRRRAPALFPRGDEAALPEPARAELRFGPIDLAALDFEADAEIAKLLDAEDPVTAWVLAAGDDAINVRAAAALYQAMASGRVPPAPIHLRTEGGHPHERSVASSRPVTVVRPFGALEATIAESFACAVDPDATARALHEAYLEEGRAMARSDPGFGFTDEPWENLSPTLQNSNRRLHRHAVMKFEDLGGQWRRARRRAVPVVDEALREPYLSVESMFDYAGHLKPELNPVWWKAETAGGGKPPGEVEAALAGRLLGAAITEHNRWTVDRALDGWRLTARPDRALRDNKARRHNNMHAWLSLDANTRRWDAVLLRALVKGDEGREGAATAWEKKVHRLVLAIAEPGGSMTGGDDLMRPGCRLVLADEIGPGVTELQILICGEPPKSELDETAASARDAFTGLLLREGILERLCRIRFDFPALPGERALAVANAMASMVTDARQPDKSAGSRVARAMARLAEVPGIEISTHWPMATPGGAKARRAPVFGVVGHRDLGRLGGADGLASCLEAFFARRLAEGRIGGLVAGYAPGADRIAVNAWLAFGAGRPVLYFPFGDLGSGRPTARAETYFTDEPGSASEEDRVDAEAVRRVATAIVSKRDGLSAHEGQALDILENCDVLVAIHDGKGSTGAGGTGDTVAKARAMGKKVIVIDRDEAGSWRNDNPDDAPGG